MSVTTECSHCGQPIHVEIGSRLECHVAEEGAAPLIFIPLVDFSGLKERCITDVF